MYVSVNAYQDADLLKGCLQSIRDELPDAEIAVVDGRYETWPSDHDNSTDATPAVAAEFEATYHPDGPYPREEFKHRHRIDLAPADERCLFIDADERLVSAQTGGFDAEQAYRVRIFNPKTYGTQATVYDGTAYAGQLTYYPRLFYPGQMGDIPRVDRYTLSVPIRRTDAITIVHRADLRSNAYREAKSERFEREERGDWYDNHLEILESEGIDHLFHECPECGQQTYTQSRVCGFGDEPAYSYVEACVGDGDCYYNIVPVEVDEWEYLPHDVDRGFRDDLSQVRLELMDAGWELAKVVPTHAFERYLPNARVWVETNLQTTVASTQKV